MFRIAVMLLSVLFSCTAEEQRGSLETSINNRMTPLCKCTDCSEPCPNISAVDRQSCAASCAACSAGPYFCDQWAYGEEYGPSCFPAEATVTLQDGSTKQMDQLAVGDVVAVGAGVYSEVYFFSHSSKEARTDMISLSIALATNDDAPGLAATTTLVLSPGHFLAVNGGGKDRVNNLVASRKVKVGDVVVLESGADGVVTAVTVVEKAEGLYNPHTYQGSIAVNGVVASCITDAIPTTAAQLLLAPVAWVSRAYRTASSVVATATAAVFRR